MQPGRRPPPEPPPPGQPRRRPGEADGDPRTPEREGEAEARRDWLDAEDSFGKCADAPSAAAGSRWYGNADGTKLNAKVWAAWGAPQRIVDAAKHGVRWLMKPGHVVAAFRGDNYLSAKDPQWRGILKKEMDKFHNNAIYETLEEWQLRYPGGTEEEFVHVVNSIGVVAKKDAADQCRPIFDFTKSLVNAALLALPFNLPRPVDFLAWCQPGYVIHKKDAKNGFYHFTLADSGREGKDGNGPRTLAGFRHPLTGELCRFCAPCMGAAQSPYFFCDMTEESARIFTEHAAAVAARLRGEALEAALNERTPDPPAVQQLAAKLGAAKLAELIEHTRVGVYVDDYVIIGPPEGVEVVNQILEVTGTALGIEFKSSKDERGAQVEVLGALITIPPADGEESDVTATITAERAERYAAELEDQCCMIRDPGSGDPVIRDPVKR